MKKYFSLVTGLSALGIECLIFLSLFEIPPFGKGGSDILWGLPFFGLIVAVLAIAGLVSATSAQRDPQRSSRLTTAGLVINGLSLAVPFVALVFGIGRALL